MPKKRLEELLDELPALIKKSSDFQYDKTVGTPGLYDMTKDIIESIMIQDARLPIGAIINWSGSIANIPQYWSLCDGTLGTPNLRDRFVIGSGNLYPVNAKAGSANHTHEGDVGYHTLTEAELPSHRHVYAKGKEGREYGTLSDDSPLDPVEAAVTDYNASVGYGHKHPLGNVSTAVTLPPYYALAFIMFRGLGWDPNDQIYINISNLESQKLYFSITGAITAGINIQWKPEWDGPWITLGGTDATSPRTLGFEPPNESFWRIQSRDNINTYSNVYQYIVTTTTTTTTTLPTITPGTLIARYDVPGGPQSIVLDSQGNTFVYSMQSNTIYKIDLNGSGPEGWYQFSDIRGRDSMTIDSQDNLYLSQRGTGIILKITPSKVVSGFASITDATNSYKEMIVGPDDTLYVKRESPFGIDKISSSGVVTSLWYSSPFSTYKMRLLPNGNLVAITFHIVSTQGKSEFVTISPSGTLLNSSSSYTDQTGIAVDSQGSVYSGSLYGGGAPIFKYDTSYYTNTNWKPAPFEGIEQLGNDDDNIYALGNSGTIAKIPFLLAVPSNMNFATSSPLGNPYGGGTGEKLVVDKIRRRLYAIHTVDETVTIIAI